MIYVFKTSVKSKRDISLLIPHLKQLVGGSNWNFDLEDCDNILRVESVEKIEFAIIQILRSCGFDCEELSD